MPKPQILNAKKIIVIGDGPAAMITCIKLHHLGVTHLTLVGPRIGSYVRSGEFNREVFQKVNRAIAPSSIIAPGEYVSSSINYIRNVEKQLYNIIQALKITCVKKKFVTFMGNKHIQVVSPLNPDEFDELEADLIFDCTGAKRSVIKEINKQTHPAPFQIKPVSDLNYNFAMARFDYSLTNIPVKKGKANDLEKTILLLKLRQLGWPFHILPLFYHFDWESGNPKQNLYFQYHDNASLKDVKEMAILIEGYHFLYFKDKKINANHFFHQPSRKHPEKKIISTFKVAPALTTPSFCLGNESFPIIIPLGDSLLNIPFIFADSLINFTHVLNHLTSALVVEDGMMKTLDLDYEKQVVRQLEPPIADIKECFLKIAEHHAQSTLFEQKATMN